MSEPGHDRFDHEEPTKAGRIQQRFERVLAGSRLLALIPVVFLMLDALGSFVYGSDILLRTAHGDVGEPARVGGQLGIFLVVMDTFLVGATLMIAAFGFYELFVLRKERDEHKYWLPNWLRMRDLEDLKARVVSMLILVAAITFVDIAVESHDEKGVLFLGLGIAVVILALTAFLRWGPRSSVRKSDDPGSGS
ncbi:MAG TPA: YqhA family protein [Streptosporangiaceae bacterium]|nr:YqhA family protein [Streptosporangiaceae bacterium]